ncbi:chalcone isomerase family protein [Polymorphum gilvum]|uniref:Chalcone isomerase domain-containing protein n=1 Tax=Polymorphum gilvum (strain LMG 25793 / CGMCC 1.9160 / SL003B-26A1) TaxID=991905 RepID=F2J0J3_POLGS|nr:chalcone isomerase family protein [Polymorphum gilvum]ADZ69660.1 hypothetical protein SL003B_1232 [Polymorphum gilvum SL003B-26A1]
MPGPIRIVAVVAVVAALLLASVSARADIGPAARLVPAAELVGKGRLTFLGFTVFDAELYAPQGDYEAGRPFALRLTYLRAFSGAAIARRSAEEMRRQGTRDEARLADWERQMRAIFPDVAPGTSITGVRTAEGHAVFYAGGRRLGAIRDAEFARRFFAIWLGPDSREPALRARLVGARS